MNADGSGQRRLARNVALMVWSPDGRKIAYSSAIGHPGRDIYVMNADGSGVRNLTRSAALEWGSTWSPDGGKIAVARSVDGGTSSDIYVMNADGAGSGG